MSLSKTVIEGSGLITLAGVGTRLLAFATVPLLSHWLGPGPYGVAAMVGTVVSLGSMMALLGIDMAYARHYLQEDTTQRGKVEGFCWRFASFSAIAVACVAGTGWYWWGQLWLPDDHTAIALYSMLAIILSVTVTMATTRVRLAGHYRKLATVLLTAALVLVIVNLSIAKFWRTDVWALLLGISVASLTTLTLLGFPNPSLLFKRSGLSNQAKQAVFRLGVAGSITAPMYWVIASSDRWFLVRFTSETVVGVYSMASSVALLGLMLNSSLTLTWFPEASRLYGMQQIAALAPLGRLWERLVVALALAWVAVSAAGGDTLRLLAAPEFHSGTVYIPWLAGGVFFYGLAGMANTAFFLESRMGRVAVYWGVGALMNLGLNTLLVPTFSAQGAAVAQTMSYGIIALGVLIASRRILPIPINWPRLGLCLLIALIAGMTLSLAWADNPLISLLIKFPIGLLVTVLLIVLIAPDWFRRGIAVLQHFIVAGKF